MSLPRLAGNWGAGNIWQITSGRFLSNSYICEINGGTNCFIVDVGLEPHDTDNKIQELGIEPVGLFCTHGHFDHAGSASFFQKKYGCEVYMHKLERNVLNKTNFLLTAFGIPIRVSTPVVNFIDDDFTVMFDGVQLVFKSTPGHTPGSCVIEFGQAWFTGDTIYRNGIGLSPIPGADSKILLESIKSLWPRMTRDRFIFPGHGKEASGEYIRKNNMDLIKFLK